MLLQAHRAVIGRITAGAGPAVAEQTDWKASLRALFDWSLEFFAREPELANLVLVEVTAATPASRRLHREALVPVRRLLEQAVAQGARPLSPTALDGMVGGMMYVIAKTAEEGDPGQLPQLRAELMAWWVLMLDGPEAAEREQNRAVAGNGSAR